MNRKGIIAFLFATIMVIAGFAGLIYYNPEIHNNKIETHKLGYHINEYNLKSLGSISHKTNFITEVPDVNGTNATNNTVIMNYTFYKGNDNVTGELLNIYVNGKLEHKSLLINSTKLNGNITIVPLYSKSGDYNVTILNNNTKNSSINNDVYVDLQAIYSWGSSGTALAFTQDMTELLITVLVVGAIISAPFSMGVVAALLSIGASVISLYDAWGGGNGVFFFVSHYWFWTYAWINSPYNQVPNDLKNYGSCTLTLYNGDLP